MTAAPLMTTLPRISHESLGIPSERDRYTLKRDITINKTNTLLLPTMRKHGIDMWIVADPLDARRWGEGGAPNQAPPPPGMLLRSRGITISRGVAQGRLPYEHQVAFGEAGGLRAQLAARDGERLVRRPERLVHQVQADARDVQRHEGVLLRERPPVEAPPRLILPAAAELILKQAGSVRR